jgi:uncharacterized protein DUF3987
MSFDRAIFAQQTANNDQEDANKPHYISEGEEVERIRAKYAFDFDPLPAHIGDAAFCGLAGQAVRIMEKHCEACPEALLLQLLVMVGNALGRNPYITAGGQTFANEFTVLVGESARGRKGTSLAITKGLLELATSDWAVARVLDGIQSGESVVSAVRDQRFGLNPRKKFKRGEEPEEVLMDAGVSDKRLMIIEEEFASLLKNAARRGSTITEVLRKSWESPRALCNSNKNSPDRASFPHISLIGHITREELKAALQNVDLANGFANRIIWCVSRRAKLLPSPEYLDWYNHEEIVNQLRKVFTTFETPRRFQRDEAAKKLWEDYYHDLSSRVRPAGLDGILARDIAHIAKLSVIYCALDCSSLITEEHLRAAIEVVEYCERSAHWIFRDTTGNRVANRILVALKFAKEGMSKTELHAELGRNISGVDLNEALNLLAKSSLIRPLIREIDGHRIECWAVHFSEKDSIASQGNS